MISVIIAHLNDLSQLHATVESILSTAFGEIEVIIVDDGSKLEQKPMRHGWLSDDRVRISSYDGQVGVAHARTIGVNAARGEWVLITDAHMIFPDGWDSTLSQYQDQKNVVWCGVYESCDSSGNTSDIFLGSRLEFIKQIGKIIHVLDQFPQKEPEKRELTVLTPCIIGAAYFIHLDWWKYIGGLTGLIGWGGDEQMLSLKTYLAGGECRVMNDVSIKHIQQPKPIGRNPEWKILYNKMLINNIIIRHSPDSFGIINKVFTQARNEDWRKAMCLASTNGTHLMRWYQHFESIRVSTLERYCNRFCIDTPREAIDLLGI
jgi:glycosyltransferase involved in cell wall biosynthesis